MTGSLGPEMTVREVERRIQVLESELAKLRESGEAMCAEFKQRFTDPPAYLTKYADRAHKEYRWRRSSAKKWRGPGAEAGVNKTFDLLGDNGRLLLEWLPERARHVWLQYEQRRITINHEIAMRSFELKRLKEWRRRRKMLDGFK